MVIEAEIEPEFRICLPIFFFLLRPKFYGTQAFIDFSLGSIFNSHKSPDDDSKAWLHNTFLFIYYK